MVTTQDRSAAKRLAGGALMLLGVASIGYGAHYLIRNGNCSSTGYVSYGPVPKCSGAEGLYITSVFFLGPALAVAGWLMSRAWHWLWPMVCVSLALGLATIKIDTAAPSGAKSLGVILGICFLALAVLSITLTARKRLRPTPPALEHPGTGPADTAPADPYQPVAEAVRTTGPPDADPLDRIAKLAKLRDSGALTDAEFEHEKAKLLSQM